jgi:hypothetical protein
MTTTFEAANEQLRQAVQQRRDAQAAGRPHEEWYEQVQAKGGATAADIVERFGAEQAAKVDCDWRKAESQPTTDPAAPVAEAEETQLDEWGMVADEPYVEHLLEQHRLKGDGIQHEQRPGSLPFLDLLEELRTLHLSKSQDYGSESDPLANIRQGAEFVGIEAWRGCMVRVADKVQRLKTYCRTGRLVHEGVRDTLLDLAAYSLLAIVLFDEGKDG